MFEDLEISPALPPQAPQHPLQRWCSHCRALIPYQEYLRHVPGCLEGHIATLWAANWVARPDKWYPDPRRIHQPRRRYSQQALQIETDTFEPCPDCETPMLNLLETWYCETCAKSFNQKEMKRWLKDELRRILDS